MHFFENKIYEILLQSFNEMNHISQKHIKKKVEQLRLENDGKIDPLEAMYILDKHYQNITIKAVSRALFLIFEQKRIWEKQGIISD